MTLIAVVLGWTAGYLSLSTYEYSYPRPKRGSIKRNIGKNFWELSCPQFLKSDFFLIYLKIELKQKNAKAHLTLSVDHNSFCLQVYHLSMSRRCRKKWDVILGMPFGATFLLLFYHLFGITCSKVPANIYFHYSIHFQNLVILWNISISTSHLLGNTQSFQQT